MVYNITTGWSTYQAVIQLVLAVYLPSASVSLVLRCYIFTVFFVTFITFVELSLVGLTLDLFD